MSENDKKAPETLLEETVRFSAQMFERLKTAKAEKVLIAMRKVTFAQLHNAVTASDEKVIRAFRKVVDRAMEDAGLAPFHGEDWKRMRIGQYHYNDIGNPLSSTPSIARLEITAYCDTKKLRDGLNVSEGKLREYCRDALEGRRPHAPQPRAGTAPTP